MDRALRQRTLDLLGELGFRPVPGEPHSHDLVTTRFSLTAREGRNERLVERVMLEGVFHDGRRMGELSLQLPPTFESAEDCAAVLAFLLSKKFDTALFPLTKERRKRAAELLFGERS
jgi:uncharacterized protein YecE (DUF72 family)